MLDYKGIEALYTVHELQSFETAAKKLHLTQSAVSQRIKGLETHYGQPVLIRTLPYKPTELGLQLIGHFKRLSLIEEDLNKQLGKNKTSARISIALNRDSLETWFLDVIKEKDSFSHITLDIIADDQELTLDYLKNGLVSACISTSDKEIIGGKVHFLGTMEYVLVASPNFIKKHFSKGISKQTLRLAPALKFDKNDNLHERYLEKFFHMKGEDLSYQIIPSVKGFKQFVKLGYGYALIPKIDIVEELEKKQLVQICQDKSWKIPLYWHSWTVQSAIYQKFNTDIIRHATNKLHE